MEKQPYLPVSVTAEEALSVCLEENMALICIKEPLYSQIRERRDIRERFFGYEVLEYREHGFLLLKKVSGPHTFDDAK